MIKVFAPVLLFIIATGYIGLIYYYTRFKFAQRRLKFLGDPTALMNRKERKAYAKELLELQHQERLQDVIFPERKKAFHPTHEEGNVH